MRAVLQSAFTVTTGLGNILVALIEATLSEVLEKVFSHYTCCDT